jgi:uncharacterized protein (TIGR02145 family)
MDKIEKLKELKSLLDSGTIDQKEFDQIKSEVLGGVAEKTLGTEIKIITVGNDLDAIKIHNQYWAKTNLNVGTFRNGDVIFEAKTSDHWEEAGIQGKPAWCYFDNDLVNAKNYGRLYNCYAITDPRSLAPKGWHIPTCDEWSSLIEKLGGKDTAGSIMKSTSGWLDSGDGTNKSGFTALPVGCRGQDGMFVDIGRVGYWWSSDKGLSDGSFWSLSLYSSNSIGLGSYDGNCGFSVRCLRDF